MERYTKERVYALIDELNIKYTVQEHNAVYTMADVDRAGVHREGVVLKNLFLKDGKGRKHFLVSVPEDRVVDFRTLGEQLGVKKLGLASPERLEKYLGASQGCVSPMGLLNDEERTVIAVFDQTLDENDIVGVHPNDTTASVWLAFRDVLKLVQTHGNESVLLAFPSRLNQLGK